MTVYAVNGLGRIGKLILKPLLERGAQIAWINDAVGDAEMHAHLLEFDTVHGRWDATFGHDAGSVTIDGTRLPFIGARDLDALPLEGVEMDETPRRTSMAIGDSRDGYRWKRPGLLSWRDGRKSPRPRRNPASRTGRHEERNCAGQRSR